MIMNWKVRAANLAHLGTCARKNASHARPRLPVNRTSGNNRFPITSLQKWGSCCPSSRPFSLRTWRHIRPMPLEKPGRRPVSRIPFIKVLAMGLFRVCSERFGVSRAKRHHECRSNGTEHPAVDTGGLQHQKQERYDQEFYIISIIFGFKVLWKVQGSLKINN